MLRGAEPAVQSAAVAMPVRGAERGLAARDFGAVRAGVRKITKTPSKCTKKYQNTLQIH